MPRNLNVNNKPVKKLFNKKSGNSNFKSIESVKNDFSKNLKIATDFVEHILEPNLKKKYIESLNNMASTMQNLTDLKKANSLHSMLRDLINNHTKHL